MPINIVCKALAIHNLLYKGHYLFSQELRLKMAFGLYKTVGYTCLNMV